MRDSTEACRLTWALAPLAAPPLFFGLRLSTSAALEKRGTGYHLLINNVEVLQFIDTYLNGLGKLGLHAFGTPTLDAFLLEQL